LLDLASREIVLQHLLKALVAANTGHLRLHPEAPWLYASGVSYAEDDEGYEGWTDIPETLARGVGGCKDLVAWRLAELRVRARETALPLVSFERALHRVKAVSVRRARVRAGRARGTLESCLSF
jgi:hypothetical protein